MEVTRKQLGKGAGGELRARQLNARRMLAGELENEDLDKHVEESLMVTTMEKAANWARGNAFMPATFGLACCALEMMGAVNARMDVARFGFEAFRASPRQADLMIISGRISIKMAPVVRRVYDQMLEPKWAIAMGACASSTGVFNNYSLVPADKFLPVDMHVPGCPPRPESLVYGILKLRAMVMAKPDLGWRTRYGGRGTEEFDPSVLEVDAQAANAENVPGTLGRTGMPSA
jgi:NADH-quinone oxidoreductase subunit B